MVATRRSARRLNHLLSSARLPMVKPLIMAGEEVRRADNVLVRVESDDGLVGWGEAAAALKIDPDLSQLKMDQVKDSILGKHVLFQQYEDGKPITDIGSLNLLSKREPLKALAMLVLLFSLAGVPPMLGFFGKLYVLKAAIDARIAEGMVLADYDIPSEDGARLAWLYQHGEVVEQVPEIQKRNQPAILHRQHDTPFAGRGLRQFRK